MILAHSLQNSSEVGLVTCVSHDIRIVITVFWGPAAEAWS